MELIQILRVGKCLRNGDFPILQNSTKFRNEAKNGLRSYFSKDQDLNCEYCGVNCMKNFDGNVIIAIGLNNALKARVTRFFKVL